jgi:hypothetical protein
VREHRARFFSDLMEASLGRVQGNRGAADRIPNTGEIAKLGRSMLRPYRGNVLSRSRTLRNARE